MSIENRAIRKQVNIVREIGGTFETYDQLLFWVEMNKQYQPLSHLLLNNPFVANLEKKWQEHWMDIELERRWGHNNDDQKEEDKFNHETFE